jgi:DmsE family decaheme c-type cytochrome
MGKTNGLRKPLLWIVGTAIVALIASVSMVSGQDEAHWIDNETCADCHDEISESFHRSAHGVYFSEDADAKAGNCQACHGPGGRHVESGEPADIVNPAKVDLIDGETTCLSCHSGHAFESWEASVHRSASIRCTSCHTLHITIPEKRKIRVSEGCYECHSEVRAAGYMPSRHPIAEGKMECTDCHNVHGGMEPWKLDGSVRETCLQCHAQFEGPFVFEHAPVAENCGYCHLPHGSVSDFLLKQSEPTLCLNCHSMHFHASVEGVDGEFETPQAPERGGVSTPDAWKRVMLTKCTQCHSEIHGTDLPSQSISGQGGSLTR